MTTNITATELKSFYAGLIISDGHISKGLSKRSFSIASINEDFTKYIKDFTDSYTNVESSIRYSEARIAKDGTRHKEYWTFSTNSHPYFNKIYHVFYDDYRKKYINQKMLNWLDLRGFANWYMSDGYCTNVGKTKGSIEDCRVEFCNDCFTYDDNLLFCKHLTKLGYRTNPITRGKTYRARMSLYDAQRFFVEIDQYVVPSMKYKLYMGIDRIWMSKEYKELKSYIKAQGLSEKKV